MRSSVFAAQLEEVVDVLGALNLRENGEILQRELDGHFDRVQVEELNLRFAHQLAGQLVRDERFGALVVLEIITAGDANPLCQILQLIG